MDILILVAAVLLIGLFCYKNVPTLIGGIVCSVILMIIYKMDITTGLFDTYMGGLVGFMKSWMILLSKKLFDTNCQAIKSSFAPSASPNAFCESALTEECTLLLLIVCLTVESKIKFRHAPDQSFMMLLR